ncbi:uncharacterized protein LOC110117103 [Athalia rosae]|uniref:uncharacterized protein LOC110117103 n=1 Tax=Athalia rosae TaxID=37344 RepID=UPI002033F821|nr:uncharacterized protein LOC110117103 [Athalia rosae]
MEAPQRKSMLNFVEGNRVSDICRLVYCAKMKSQFSENVLKSLNTSTKEYNISSDFITGLLLVYPNCMVHLIEAPEEEIFQLCRHLFITCSHLIGQTKCFPIQVEVVGRFFDKWYARKASQSQVNWAEVPEGEKGRVCLEDHFENASKIYETTLINLYKFYKELRLLSNKNHTMMVEQLEALNEDGHPLLPDGATMDFILNSSWGQSLEEITNRFLYPVSIDPNTAWPFPKVTVPRINFHKIDEIKDSSDKNGANS